MKNLDHLDFCVDQEAEPLLRLSQEKGVGGFRPFRLVPAREKRWIWESGTCWSLEFPSRSTEPWNWAPCANKARQRWEKRSQKSKEKLGGGWDKNNPQFFSYGISESTLSSALGHGVILGSSSSWMGEERGLGNPISLRNFSLWNVTGQVRRAFVP